MRRPATLLAAAFVALAAAGLTVGSPAAAQEAEGESSPVEADEAVGSDRVVVADGHVDVGPRFVDGTFTLLVRDDTVDPSVWRQVSDVVLHATDAAAVQVPDDPTFSFLGPPGAQIWLLPQVQQPGILWPGWNTQDPEVATTLRREVTWTLTDVEGPGAFLLFVNEEFGQPATIFDSRQPYPQPTGIDLSTHAHGNWAFTEPGVYRLTMELTATTTGGDEVTASGTLQLAVGDATNPQDAFAPADEASATEDGSSAGPGRDPATSTGSDRGDADGAAGSSAGDDDGSSAPLLGLAAGAVLLVGIALLVARARRRRAASSSSSSSGNEPPAPSAADGS